MYTFNKEQMTEIREWFDNGDNNPQDCVKTNHNGAACLRVRSSYYYRHGRTAESWGNSAVMGLRELGYTAHVLHTEDRWANYPKTSYFYAWVEVTGRIGA